MRQKVGAELSFVSFSNQASNTNVFINTTGLSIGEHTLILESYDTESDGVESALKTDNVTIQVIQEVTDCPLATFTEEVEAKTIVSGEKSKWSLPEIDACEDTVQIVIVPDSLMLNYITYDEKSAEISYDGSLIPAVSTQNRFATISITLVNSAGSSSYE